MNRPSSLDAATGAGHAPSILRLSVDHTFRRSKDSEGRFLLQNVQHHGDLGLLFLNTGEKHGVRGVSSVPENPSIVPSHIKQNSLGKRGKLS
jgi:hypothetical protein